MSFTLSLGQLPMMTVMDCGKRALELVSSEKLCRFVRAEKMVLKTELCRFSGIKIYPGRGIRFVRSDSQVFLFFNSKCKRYFHNRLKPGKLSWTTLFRKQHKKILDKGC
ncbi:60S ribosomal protein L24-like isoform X2 [Lolium rigidum]|uniref:60S ribosomal protein L24-like isoform X2 n=1 Tax=Lolium rigidum TaxID=89674 RepID=UPI001F5C40D3|nr:60S ribosomal protein L24-like isoform X2 [Lolium rigidum]